MRRELIESQPLCPPPAARRPSACSVPRPSACLARHGESLSCAWEQTHGRSDHVLVADGLPLGALRGCTIVAARLNGDARSNDTFKSNDTLPLDFSSYSPDNDQVDHLPSDSSGVDWFDDDSPGGNDFPRRPASRRRHLYQTPGRFSTTQWIN